MGYFSACWYLTRFTGFCFVVSLCDVDIVNFPYRTLATALWQAFKILPTGSSSSLGVRPNKLKFPFESSFILSYNLASLLYIFAWLDLPKIVAKCSDTDGPYFLHLVSKLPQFCDCPLWGYNFSSCDFYYASVWIDTEYQLCAAVVHEGQSTSSGHFYTLVWSDDDRCVCCDDQRITELSVEDAAQSSAAVYLGMYAHVGKLFVIVSACSSPLMIVLVIWRTCSNSIASSLTFCVKRFAHSVFLQITLNECK